MAKTSIEIDDNKLGAVKDILGTSSKRGTVDAALDEIIARRRREQLVDLLQGKKAMDLDDPEIMEAAWR